jgi:hypothetical protein
MVKTGAFLKFLLLKTIVLLIYCKFLPPTGPAYAQELDVPSGFYTVASTTGVHLFRKDYPGGTPDFVQVVNLSHGASLNLLHGEIREARVGKGVYGGNDPRLGFNTLKSYWNHFTNSHENAFCVLNGLFFYMKESPTRLPFPLKVDGEIITDGYAITEFIDQKLMLEIWDDHAAITPLTKDRLYTSSAPNIIAGLSEQANKRGNHYTGRTFVGVDNRNGSSTNEIVLIFNTKTARQVDAAEVLRRFGADEVMMLDGGGSTQLICEGNIYVSSDRLIPQAIAVAGGKPGVSLSTTTLAPSPSATPSPTPGESVILTVDQPSPPIQEIPQTTMTGSGGLFQINDLIWIPILMLPVEAVLIIIILKIRQLSTSTESY